MLLGILFDVLKVLQHGFAYRNFLEAGPECRREFAGISIGPVRRAEGRHGYRLNAAPRKAERIKAPHRDKEGKGRIKSARKPQHGTGAVNVVKALFQAECLYPKDFLAALRARLGLCRHKGCRVHLSRELGLRET